MRITFKPSIYAICALLAASLVGGPVSGQASHLLELLALWVLADLALGAYYAGLLDASGVLPWAGGQRRPGWGSLLAAVVGGGLAVLVASWFAAPVRYLTAAGLALGALVILGSAHSPERGAIPLLAGLQVLVAWSLGMARQAPWQDPMLLVGLAAGLGTWLRLRHRAAPSRATLWATRLIWAGLAATVLAARQPLLGSLVAITALADDLQRLAPRRQGVTEALMGLGWVGTWLLVALASNHWGNAI